MVVIAVIDRWLFLFKPYDAYLQALLLIVAAAIVGAAFAILVFYFRWQDGIRYQKNKEHRLRGYRK